MLRRTSHANEYQRGSTVHAGAGVRSGGTRSRNRYRAAWSIKQTPTYQIEKRSVDGRGAKCGDCVKRLLAQEILLAQKELLDGDGSSVWDVCKPVFIVHDTGDGFIYSKAERRGRKSWARRWCDTLDGGRECATMHQANEFLIRSFVEMFPEHRCTRRCRTDPGTPAR
jgi:hypothetical protein